MSKQQVCDEEYLRCGVNKVDGEVVVCVGGIVVNPKLPSDGSENWREDEHAEDDEGLLHEGKEVREQGKECEEEANIADAGVGFEHRYEPDDHGGEEKRLVWKPDRERSHVEDQVDLEGTDEEDSEVVKHLGEEIPEYSHVRCQLRNSQDEAIDRVEIAPASCDLKWDQLKETECSQECWDHGQDS